MDLQAVAGVVLIASFIFLVLGALIAPADAYRGDALQPRLKAIAENQTRWRFGKVFDGLAIFSPAIAFLLLAIALAGEQPRLPLVLGGVGFFVSGIVGVYVVYRAAVDPLATFTEPLPRLVDIAGSVGMSLGMILVGVAYLQGAFPLWIGYLSIAAGVLSLGAYAVVGGSIAFLVAALLFIVNVVIGVVLIAGSS